MSLLIRLLEIYAAISILVCMYLVPRYNVFWLIYAIGCIPYTTVMLVKGCEGFALMGVVLFCTGIRNYWKGRRNE